MLAKLRQFPLDPYLGKLTAKEADVAIYSFITKYKICHKRSECQVGQNFITTHTSNNGDVFSEVLILGQVHLQDPGSYYTPIYAKACSCMHLSLSESISLLQSHHSLTMTMTLVGDRVLIWFHTISQDFCWSVINQNVTADVIISLNNHNKCISNTLIFLF